MSNDDKNEPGAHGQGRAGAPQGGGRGGQPSPGQPGTAGQGEGHGVGSGNRPPSEQKHRIQIDDKEYEVVAKEMTGAQIKALASIPAGYQLFLEQPGDDRQVADASEVKMHSNMRFYAVPPATFG
ncbi:MAG TPA: multiubiquitin domain-containing protein [Allosphingosinicella sp.]